MESVLDVSLLSIVVNDKEWNRECNGTETGRSYKHFGGQD